jgi:hypothetical protein
VTGLGIVHDSVSLINSGRSVSRVCLDSISSGEALMAALMSRIDGGRSRG